MDSMGGYGTILDKNIEQVVVFTWFLDDPGRVRDV